MLNKLIVSNINTLQEGRQLLEQLELDHYTQTCEPAFLATMGGHFRHLLEHYQCLFDQLPKQQICYDKRCRNQILETDINEALQCIDRFIQYFQGWHDVSIEQTLIVTDMQTDETITSTLERELLFLQAHTTHHYAMIAAMSRLLGLTPQADFGVAIATRAANHQVLETTKCAP